MNILQAIILGIVEGVTEYLPISSTFHLIWSSRLLGLESSEFLKLFEVCIQSGAILAVITLYFKTLTKDWETLKKVGLSFLPTAVVGFLLHGIIKQVFFESVVLQLSVFMGVGVLFIGYEKLLKKSLTKTIDDLSYSDAVLVGVAQSLAVVPGVSRAGAVIVALLMLRVKRDEAAKYSFLLAAPTLMAAGALDIVKSLDVIVGHGSNVLLLGVGSLAAFLSAMIVMKWFVNYLQKNDLSTFGWYRLLVGLVLVATVFTA